MNKQIVRVKNLLKAAKKQPHSLNDLKLVTFRKSTADLVFME